MSENLRYDQPHFSYYGPPKLLFHFIKSCISHLNNTLKKIVVWLEKHFFKGYSKRVCLVKA